MDDGTLVKDTKVAQCKMTDELAPEKPNRNLTKSEMAQLERKLTFLPFFFYYGIDTLDCMV